MQAVRPSRPSLRRVAAVAAALFVVILGLLVLLTGRGDPSAARTVTPAVRQSPQQPVPGGGGSVDPGFADPRGLPPGSDPDPRDFGPGGVDPRDFGPGDDDRDGRGFAPGDGSGDGGFDPDEGGGSSPAGPALTPA